MMNFFSPFLSSKTQLIVLTWGLALALSLVFRYWGFQHPDPFVIRPLLVTALLLGPSLILLIWIPLTSFRQNDASGSIVVKDDSK